MKCLTAISRRASSKNIIIFFLLISFKLLLLFLSDYSFNRQHFSMQLHTVGYGVTVGARFSSYIIALHYTTYMSKHVMQVYDPFARVCFYVVSIDT